MEREPSSPITPVQLGLHVLGELRGCNPAQIASVEPLRAIMLKVAEQANFRIVGERFHQFEPAGVTGVFLLAESHFSVHTWPEQGIVAADIFTCGNEGNAEHAFDFFVAYLRPTTHHKQVIVR